MMPGGSECVAIPGTDAVAAYERDATGRLLRLAIGGRDYVALREGTRHYDGDFVRSREVMTPRVLKRTVHAATQTWCEVYRWDERGRLEEVDGAKVTRDARGRVTACGDWRYDYTDDYLTRIAAPDGERNIRHSRDGRPLVWRDKVGEVRFAYSEDGARRGTGEAPAHWYRDDAGRLWTICDSAGRVRHTFLWDGFFCLARIDGAPGEPLAAVFSLDPTATPVRVITRNGVERIPRDAYGEALLDHPNVPGLFGGAVAGRYVRYRARALDPRLGCYTSLDPFSGGEDDPRRVAGYRGPLAVEGGYAGPYAVCQHDPIGYVDPTGEISAPYLLSSLTWAFQNNWMVLFGLHFTLNLSYSLFYLLFLSLPTWDLDPFLDFFRMQGISSRRGGVDALNIKGLLGSLGQVFTTQHVVWADPEEVNSFDDWHVFVPSGAFRPTFYGSLIHLAPSGSSAMLLRGSLPANGKFVEWTRGGGVAEATVPDSRVPNFPTGGLHLPRQSGRRGTPSATIQELVPNGPLGSGVLQGYQVVDFPASLALVADDLALLTDAAAGIAIARVLSVGPVGSNTRVRFDSTALAVAATGIRVRKLGAAGAAESLTPGGPGQSLLTTGSNAPYAANDVLRLTQGAVVGAALVSRLEVQLAIDAAVPNDFQAPLDVTLATDPGAPTRNGTLGANDTTFNAPTGPLPTTDQLLLVIRGAVSIAVAVRSSDATTRTVVVDRSLAALGGTNLQYRFLAIGAPLGNRADVPEAGATLTYTPVAPDSAPAAGFVRVRDARGVPVARVVTARTYDAIVLSSPLPGNAAAQFSVERFPIVTPPDQGGGVLATESVLALTPTVPIDGQVLRLTQLNAPALAPTGAAAAGWTVTGNSASIVFGAAGAPAAPTSQPVVGLESTLTLGATTDAAVVATIRVDAVFDRILNLGAGPFEIVGLQVVTPSYDAVRLADFQLTVLPFVTGAGRVELPRFAVGQIIKVGVPPDPARIYRVTAIDGSTLTLSGAQVLPANSSGAPTAPATLVVQRLDVASPANGGTRLGIRGTLVPTVPPVNTTIRFEVASPDAFVIPGGSAVVGFGVVDGAQTLGVLVVSSNVCTVVFTDAPSTVGANVSIATPNVAGVDYALTFRTEGATLIVSDPLPSLTTPSPNLVLVTAFKAPANGARADGAMSPGEALIPDDPENWSLTRRDTLIFHELRHTEQYLWLGPLFFAWFPTFAVDLTLAIAAPETELPDYSPFVAATIETAEDGVRKLAIPAPGGTTYAKGDKVQLGQGTTLDNVTLKEVADGKFQLTGATVRDGSLFVRKRNDIATGWYATRVVDNILHSFTHAGLMNMAAGATYGTMYQLIGRFVFFIARLFGGSGRMYRATVQDNGLGLKLVKAADASHFVSETEVLVRTASAKQTVVRTLTSVGDDAVLHLRAPIIGATEVEVGPYATRTPGALWDWNKFWPGEVVTDRPTSVRVKAVDGSLPSFRPFDRVLVKAGEEGNQVWPFSYPGWHSRVSAVTESAADHVVIDLEDAPPFSGTVATERTLRISPIGERDPLGFTDNILLDEWAQLGWIRWITDPLSQLSKRINPKQGSVGDVFLRAAKILWGTSAWSSFPPLIGGEFFRDRAWESGTESWIEQDASSNSSETYTPISRMRGEVSTSNATATMTVGDIARFWHFPLARNGVGSAATFERISASILSSGAVQSLQLRDAPGVSGYPKAIVMPQVTAESNTSNVNFGAQAGPGAGGALADVFFQKALANPTGPTPAAVLAKVTALGSAALTAPTPVASYAASDLGWVPATPQLDQTFGTYVAFTQPSGPQPHRVTVGDNVLSGAAGRLAQNNGVSLGFGIASFTPTIFFDVTVNDVQLTLAGQPVAEGATVKLLRTQLAPLAAIPTDAKRYVLSLLRPLGSTILRTPDGVNLQAMRANGSEAVQIDRLHPFDVASGSFQGSGLAQHGMHLPQDVHIAVRRITVQVVNNLPVVPDPLPTPPATLPADPYAAPVPALLPGGHVFILIASNVLRVDATVSYPVAPPPDRTDPTPVNFQVDTASFPSVTTFVGAGQTVEADLNANDPPEEAAEYRVVATVGTTSFQDTASVTIPLQPHYQLTAGSFVVARPAAGAPDVVFSLAVSGGVVVASVTATPSPGPGAGVAAAVAAGGTRIDVTITAAATQGRWVIQTTEVAPGARQARRTIRVA